MNLQAGYVRRRPSAGRFRRTDSRRTAVQTQREFHFQSKFRTRDSPHAAQDKVQQRACPLHHASSWNITRISRDAYARVT